MMARGTSEPSELTMDVHAYCPHLSGGRTPLVTPSEIERQTTNYSLKLGLNDAGQVSNKTMTGPVIFPEATIATNTLCPRM